MAEQNQDRANAQFQRASPQERAFRLLERCQVAMTSGAEENEKEVPKNSIWVSNTNMTVIVSSLLINVISSSHSILFAHTVLLAQL